jgi:hypothetical protein
MTVFPASGAAGKPGKALTGTVTTTMSPAAAASPLVAADAAGPSSAARSASVSGPRELLSTTLCPAAMASRAMALPICPLPMNPTVVMFQLPFRGAVALSCAGSVVIEDPRPQLAGK